MTTHQYVEVDHPPVEKNGETFGTSGVSWYLSPRWGRRHRRQVRRGSILTLRQFLRANDLTITCVRHWTHDVD